MAVVRSPDQKVDTFSAPKQLLERVIEEARARRMTKSGFIRYALAKELGFSEDRALDFAMHASITNPPKPRSSPSPKPSIEQEISSTMEGLVDQVEAEVARRTKSRKPGKSAARPASSSGKRAASSPVPGDAS